MNNLEEIPCISVSSRAAKIARATVPKYYVLKLLIYYIILIYKAEYY